MAESNPDCSMEPMQLGEGDFTDEVDGEFYDGFLFPPIPKKFADENPIRK